MQKKHPAVISCLFSQCLFNLNSPHLNVTFSCCVIWELFSEQNCVGVILKGLGWDSRPNISGQFASWRLSELHKLSHRRWALQICSLLLGTFSLNFFSIWTPDFYSKCNCRNMKCLQINRNTSSHCITS